MLTLGGSLGLLARSGVALAAALWSWPLPAAAVVVAGRGEQFTPDPYRGMRSVLFGISADASLGPSKGYVTVRDKSYALSFSGSVRTMTVLEADQHGVPGAVQLEGVSLDRISSQFTCIVRAADAEHKAQLALSIRGATQYELPLRPITRGYLTMR